MTDDRLAHMAAEARQTLAAMAPDSEERRRAHQILVRQERGLRNTPGGYWVVAADPQAAHHALTGTEPATDIQRAALLTDGAARPVTTFHTTDWNGLLDLLTHHGPRATIHTIRETEHSDPHLNRRPRSKQHDDATIAHLHLHL
ncbi:hypothetical protein GCM10010305_00930 [Streptomyces termitum]|uniref:Uncharacterized protein n=1 Tax=Streptomyces termitum TaxID=67368 RepID=A0A918W3I7_9ACTN|nr:hypothetical protein GCM10010305_00930 [Streptomyces termitum]